MATTQQIREIWTALNMAYPYFGQNRGDPREMAQTLKLWEQMLGDLDGNALLSAAKAHIATSTFFPSIAELRKAAIALLSPQRVPAIVAWGDVMAAQAWAWPGRYRELVYTVKDAIGVPLASEIIVREDIGGEPPFDNPLTAQACRILGGWRAIMASECPAAERARFVEAYEALAASEQADSLVLPEARAVRQIDAGRVNGLVRSLAQKMTSGIREAA